MTIIDPELGRVDLPKLVTQSFSYPGHAVHGPGELGIFIAKQHRPIFVDGLLHRLELIWASITANERVDQGAVQQDIQMFGAATAKVFTAIAVASATLVKTKTDLSLGSASGGVTTNEFTTIGLSRAAGSLGTYTAPASLGAVFSRVITKTFNVTGTGTAYGAGLFDSTTVAGSNLYVEDNFASSASLSNGDTLTVNATISN